MSNYAFPEDQGLAEIERRLRALERTRLPSAVAYRFGDQVNNVSLSTTWALISTQEVFVHRWAGSVFVLGSFYAQISSSVTQNIGLAYTTDGDPPSGIGAEFSGESGFTRAGTLPFSVQDQSLWVPGSTGAIYLWAQLNTGTNSSNGFNVAGSWLILP